MSPSESRNGREADSIPEGGVLAALPRARPQRASARRAAARSGAVTKTKPTRTTTAKKPARAAAATKPTTGKKRASAKAAARTRQSVAAKRRIPKPIAKPVEPPAPKQGYEPEEEVELGATVHPPSGAELVESMADIVGELAGSSLAAGGRLLKDAFSLLRRP